MRIKVGANMDGTPIRIEGYANIPCYQNERETHVITLSTLNNQWTVAYSMCLPVDIDSARIVQACMTAAFTKLKSVMLEHPYAYKQ